MSSTAMPAPPLAPAAPAFAPTAWSEALSVPMTWSNRRSYSALASASREARASGSFLQMTHMSPPAEMVR
eukprot:scaffold48424_cov236-Isochrysis_galbana.AAC.1